MEENKIPKQPDRRKTIEIIKTPLHFFALALLIVETFLGIVLVGSGLQETGKIHGMYLGVGLFVFVIVIVGFVIVIQKAPWNLIYFAEHLLEAHKLGLVDLIKQHPSALADEPLDVVYLDEEADGIGTVEVEVVDMERPSDSSYGEDKERSGDRGEFPENDKEQ